MIWLKKSCRGLERAISIAKEVFYAFFFFVIFSVAIIFAFVITASYLRSDFSISFGKFNISDRSNVTSATNQGDYQDNLLSGSKLPKSESPDTGNKAKRFKDVNRDNKDLADLIITYTGLLIALLSALGGFLWWAIGKKAKKFDEIDDKIKELDKSLILSAEMAIIHVPSFVTTQHVPYDVLEVARKFSQLFEGSKLIDTLKESKNGVLLRYTIGLYYFGDREYDECIKQLKEIEELYRVPQRIKKLTYERMAICYRYLKNWDKSIEYFDELEKKIIGHKNEAQIGKAITYLHRYVYNNKEKSALEEAVNTIKNIKMDELELRNTHQMFYLPYILYWYLLIYKIDIKEYKKEYKNIYENSKIVIEHYIKNINPEYISKDYAIKANYYEAIGICWKLYYEFILENPVRNNNKHFESVLLSAQFFAKKAQDENCPAIYSELDVKEIKPEKFIENIEKFKKKEDIFNRRC